MNKVLCRPQIRACSPICLQPREPIEESALHSGHLAVPRFAQYCHRCLHFADSSIVSLSSKKNRAAVPGNSVGNGTISSLTDRLRECVGGPSQSCFLAGDDRVNEQPNLAVMHTLFVREHNRIARQLAKFNPNWNDEKLFEETRRIVNAEWQHIVYNEWLPIVLGQRYMTSFGLFPLTDGFSSNYRTDFDPRITNAFAAAAFRIGHSLIPGLIK